jgi:hypothetical protein
MLICKEDHNSVLNACCCLEGRVWVVPSKAVSSNDCSRQSLVGETAPSPKNLRIKEYTLRL